MRYALALTLIFLLASGTLGQTTPPSLEGTRITIEHDGVQQRFRLVADPDPVVNKSPDATFAILLDETVAPAGVSVHATGLEHDPLTTRYQWDFGDPKSDRNVLPGFVAGHVYDNPGTYTIRLKITPENAQAIELTRSVTIEADLRKTIHVSPDGDDARDGSQTQPIRTLKRAGEIAINDVRILLERGKTFDVDSQALTPGKRVLIGAYGDAKLPKPIIRYTGKGNAEAIIRASDKTTGLVVENLTFDSLVGAKPDASELPHCIVLAGRQVVVRNCTFLNVSYAINGNGNPSGVLVQNCDAPTTDGLRRYLAWIQGTDWTILDNRALNSTREHIVRGAGYDRVLVAFNTFANISRRESGADPVDIAKTTVNLQFGNFGYIHGNTLTGPSSIGPLGKADGLKFKEQRAKTFVVESNTFNSAPFEVQHGISDVMIRNNTFGVDDNRSIVLDGYNSEFGRGISDVTIRDNVARNAGKTGGFLLVGAGVKEISLIGNRYVAPKLQSGASQTANVYVADKDLSGFASISDNTWSIGNPTRYANGGVMYVWPKWSDPAGYIDPNRWNALPAVKNDSFK